MRCCDLAREQRRAYERRASAVLQIVTCCYQILLLVHVVSQLYFIYVRLSGEKDLIPDISLFCCPGDMPRYDDRYGNTRLYVGKLAPRTRSRDLEYIFSKYGRVRDVEMKRDYAFIEFSDPRDADEAQYQLDGRDVDGSRIIVEFAKGVPRGSGGSREYMGRGPPPGTGRCFNCGIDGHWARDCKAGDWKNKCYRCGERGHIERNCQNSPRSVSRSRSRSVSGSPRGGRREQRRSRSLSYSRSPRRSVSPPAKERSPTPNGSRSPRSLSPRDQVSPPPKDNDQHIGDSPRGRSRSPSDGGRSPAANGHSPSPRGNRSPSPMDNRSLSPRENRSPSPRDNRSPSPMDNGNGDEDHPGSPRRSRSP
ncbi:hypothetical protein PR202_ga11059 [Eleusine coracana subsp. coracana]|uniref:Arginine/serine-rich splicing factor n=1 Tax=Eleusine coracana subsp. coracana TaxID=191504 RepID=A0AAV5C8D4_ELECO|nr:hypothetical protein PR202_ga11059 [Eleusine coracana subsp. coracana]